MSESGIAAAPTNAPSTALSLLNVFPGNNRLARAVQAGVLAGAAYQYARKLHTDWANRNSYTIRISSRDDLYHDVQQWLLSQMPSRDQRSLTASSAHSSGGNDSAPRPIGGPSPGGSKRGPIVHYSYDGQTAVTLSIGGQPVTVVIEQGKPSDKDRDYFYVEHKILFHCPSVAARRAVQEALEALAVAREGSDLPRVYTPRWGQWFRTSSLVGRDPSTVILPPGVMDGLIGDLGRFLASEARYASIGIPWHWGCLLYGPPGTGKTSVVRAVAYAHRMPLYCLPLSDVPSDAALLELFGQVPERAILLIEDVDISQAATEMEDGGGAKRASLQGFLNALDGAVTPHGLVTFLTTNNRDRLPKAAIRPGRCDREVEIGYLTSEQLARLVEMLTGTPFPGVEIPSGRHIVAAEITNIVTRHINDMEAARNAIWKYLVARGVGVAA